MKIIFSFLLSLVLGFVLFFGAVMGMSYSLTGEGSMPDATELTFEGAELEVNGYNWHVPLIGGALDKEMQNASSLSVQKLGTITTTQPTFTLPDWVNYGYITVSETDGTIVFMGSLDEYAEFSYPANGDYKVTAAFWHLPHSTYPEQRIEVFEDSGIIGGFCTNSGIETPAEPTGYYSYSFRFTLSATAILTLSADSASVGTVVALQIDGIMGDDIPTISTDLGDITALPFDGGYRAYLPIAYNTSSGEHLITVTVGDEIFETAVTVSAIDHAKVELTEAEYSGTDAENTEYRSIIWDLYDDEATEKAWYKAWTCPVSSYTIMVDYSNAKYYEEVFLGYSNCIVFAVEEGSNVFAPSAGTVVYAGYLGLTGNTIVIDHGHGVRTYLYGLDTLAVTEGDALIQNQIIATTTDSVTLDVKIGSKSISPWALFRETGGMFWQE